MFKVKQLVDGVWVEASAHTLEVDAIEQMQRFIDSGTPADNLKIEEAT